MAAKFTVEQWEDLERMGLAKKISLKKEEATGKDVFSTSDGNGNKSYFRYEKIEDFDRELDTKVKMQAYDYYKAGSSFFGFSIIAAVIALVLVLGIYIMSAIADSKAQKNGYRSYYKNLPNETTGYTEVI